MGVLSRKRGVRFLMPTKFKDLKIIKIMYPDGSVDNHLFFIANQRLISKNRVHDAAFQTSTVCG